MAYTIIKTNGTVLTTIADGTVNNTSSSLELPGRNYAGYGVIMDTNFVHLLENFADDNVPPNPIKGQLWYNSSTQAMYVCPTDGELNINNWLRLASSSDTDVSFINLTLSGYLAAKNAYISDDIFANSITANYLRVNANANLFGTSTISTIVANTITAGVTTGTFNGNWNFPGNLSAGIIKSDNYRYANNSPIPIYNIAGNTYELQYNVSGNFGATSNLSFNPVTNILTVVGNINTTQIIGNGIGLTNIAAANLSGTIASSVQNNITSLGTLGNLNVTNTITAANVNVSNVSASNITGTVKTSAQPSITSLGTLAGLISGGLVNFTSASNVSLGPVSNVHITGGSTNYLLSTNGSGVLSWKDPLSLVISANGSNTQVQFNNSGVLGGSANFTYDIATNILAVVGNINSSNASLGNTAAANYFVGSGYNLTSINGSNIAGQVPNAIVAGTVYTAAQPNITSVGTLSSLTATGNIDSSANMHASYFIGNGSQLTYVAAVTSLVANKVVDNAQPNITSTGTLTTLDVSGTGFFGGFTQISGYSTEVGIRFSGGIGQQGLSFKPIIDGANAIIFFNSSNVQIGSVSQTASNVTFNGLVTGSNVTGQVNYAAVANSVAGANVTGQVNYAAVANSVAGANVTGQVNYAATANSVAGGNVVGTVGSASIAGTVTTAAQPNITSVGTLSSLNVSGNINTSSYYTGNGYYLTGIVTIPSGVIVMWSGSIASIPSGWKLCDGTSGTPDLRDRFIIGAGNAYAVSSQGGYANSTLVTHTHSATITDPGHHHLEYGFTEATYGFPTTAPGGAYPGYLNTSTSTTGIAVTNSTEGSTGVGKNIPPYYALAYIMKS